MTRLRRASQFTTPYSSEAPDRHQGNGLRQRRSERSGPNRHPARSLRALFGVRWARPRTVNSVGLASVFRRPVLPIFKPSAKRSGDSKRRGNRRDHGHHGEAPIACQAEETEQVFSSPLITIERSEPIPNTSGSVSRRFARKRHVRHRVGLVRYQPGPSSPIARARLTGAERIGFRLSPLALALHPGRPVTHQAFPTAPNGVALALWPPCCRIRRIAITFTTSFTTNQMRA